MMDSTFRAVSAEVTMTVGLSGVGMDSVGLSGSAVGLSGSDGSRRISALSNAGMPAMAGRSGDVK